jgi:acetyl esterase/lipase
MPSQCQDAIIDTGRDAPMRVRRYGVARRGAPLVLHLHGGAFQSCPLDSGQTVAELLAEAGATVISADYPAGPEHPFPQALEAVYALAQRLWRDRVLWADKSGKLFVAGEEAGGNLAAALAMVARDRRDPPLSGQILLSPMLDAGMATCSIRTADAGPVGCKWADGWHDYLGSPDKAFHPYASPASASRLAGLAPALVLTARDDPMRDESLNYARRLRDSGVAVHERTIAGPTLWPDSLGRPLSNDTQWVAEVRDALSAFFAGPDAIPNSREGTDHD